jgi:hypothetical protein
LSSAARRTRASDASPWPLPQRKGTPHKLVSLRETRAYTQGLPCSCHGAGAGLVSSRCARAARSAHSHPPPRGCSRPNARRYAKRVVTTTGNGTWTAPALVASAFSIPGGHLATGNQGTTQLDVFAIGTANALEVTWAVGTGAWNAPVNLSPTGVAFAGTPVATGLQNGTQLDVFFTETNGSLQVVWAAGLWFGPLTLTTGVIYTAELSTAQVGTTQLDLFYTSNVGNLSLLSVTGTGAWVGPTVIAADAALSGAATATATQGSGNQVDLFTIANLGLARSASTGGAFSAPVKIVP